MANAELWNNMGLCCFYSGQYDLTLSCFERALMLADDNNMADVWYNIGQVAIGVGDLGLAYQAFKIAVSVDPNHAESYSNLGVLELRKGNVEQACRPTCLMQHIAFDWRGSAVQGAAMRFRKHDRDVHALVCQCVWTRGCDVHGHGAQSHEQVLLCSLAVVRGSLQIVVS